MSVRIGNYIATESPVSIDDIGRRSGVYILGKPGFGKTNLLAIMLEQDIKNGHGVFFIDPHGDAISELALSEVKRINDVAMLLDPEEDQFSFGINLLSCADLTSLRERVETYNRAYKVFYRLWEHEWGPWLQLIVQNTLYAFIENPGYTLAEVPMFLIDSAFRTYIVENMKYNTEVASFWKHRFESGRRERLESQQIDAALTRINTLLGHPYVRNIIGQSKTTLNFKNVIEQKKLYSLNYQQTLPQILSDLSAQSF